MNNKKIVLTLAVLVAAIMILSSMALFLPQSRSADHSTGNAGSNSLAVQAQGFSAPHLPSRASNTLNDLNSKGISSKYVFLPNFGKSHLAGNQVNGTSYTQAPAPFGIGTYGLAQNNGKLVRYNINSSSFEGSFSVNSLKTFYGLDDSPNGVTVQLNAVLNNVTLFGSSHYSFWTQNVIFYSARTHQLLFIDNIWNFSSPSFYMSPNVFHSYDGNLVSPYFYYAIGNLFNVTYPFTVHFYLNSTIIQGRNTVFFNYSLNNGGKVTSGSYDEVQFNSTYGMPSGYSAPQANYLVTSNVTTPTGFIPYDAEIMIGGPGGGSTAMIYQIDATMTLKYLGSSGSYANVPSAYNVGSETGETSAGVAVTWSQNGVAHLGAGPSFVYGMWNVSQTNQFNHYKGQVTPSNSFMFVSPGSTFSDANASWAPLSMSGKYSFSLPSGKYNAGFLLSDHSPEYAALKTNSNQKSSLPVNISMGLYTPLYAYGNSQLQYISQSGKGTQKNPYVLYNNPAPSGQVNPLFASMNDYAFPSFSGVLLKDTSAYVLMDNMPGFKVVYPAYEQQLIQFFGFLPFNYLGYFLYNTSHATLMNSYISGYFTTYESGFPVANLVLWNSNDNLIASNYFDVMDSGMLIYNQRDTSGGNMVWGNYFIQNSMLNSSNYPPMNIWGGPLALSVFSSGNTIYNNAFIVYYTAYSPTYSIYTYNSGTMYLNMWNITKQPASNVNYFNGYALSGSIVGTTYQGGNFWWNYIGPGTPYTDNGLIAYGGDYVPLVTHTGGIFEPLVTDFKHP